ncbi:hypothetical protein LYSIN_01237 [Lysinibacillus sphaericus]|uniref:Uncharacterized protein n=1 Tax=Lysinibacillus sphaericus TaxID=1421 RepID=A0A2S5D065_LYSSH|nr:hypothetical protein [Lysinibacillus sphaericus]POZ56454.1 hypothetical protein LYSIN_01237 [Lysinibacillus sphaericus]
MTHFEYMEQQGQLTIFDLMDQYEERNLKSLPQMFNKPVDKKTFIVAHKVGYIVRR